MLSSIIHYSIRNKLIILLFTIGLIGAGIYSLFNIPIGAVPDVTNNQVQVITTSRDLSTQDVERYLTYPVELEMANLPGVQEIRSISKFGLSVVTIVFDDDLGTYLPRQLISERLKTVEDQIPEGFGSPSMGPISTGLGEIYQYILDVKPAYADRYSVAELRTMQDWIVKRQLSGIPGVVEVNTWGGFLKTYEVAIDPNTLQSMGITVQQVYDALETNNSVSGGGYIEKSKEAYFIRAEGSLGSIDDINNIVVTRSGTPILIKDIAKVGFGAATRFGAITGNGEGEKILGQVMMLKGADSKKVIDRVIDRVAEVQSSLPPGVFINPFLERSDLIGRTTSTIAENLIFGFLIVLFVVVFLLGNLRSGLVVASVIPLTLCFALTAMYLFGIDANLMSLGAIDFGIIIDGAVIIVEYLSFKLAANYTKLNGLAPQERKSMTEKIIGESASKMMHSATFGQIIIIIVFIPVLGLAGIEGKMFKPMAMTFCFAVIGAMILCFTYVPVMASLFIKAQSQDHKNMSTRFIALLQRIYRPLLVTALKLKAVVLILAVLLLVVSAILFNRMGAEFVPTLDEGDFVIQPVLKVGMSLAETVKMTTRIENICLKFPEVKQVVSRIGAAEVPTDPMSLEESDVIITLKEKADWTTVKTKDALADTIKEALLAEIPGIEIEFTQPIEMRFNELISGVSSDLAIKVFGEDLDILYDLSNEIESEINNIDGVADISVEKIDGLPQMSIVYDRQQIARYGVNIQELNDLISIGFAGKSTGVIFEGERQFDLVLRYGESYRKDLQSIMEALVDLPNGQQMPMSQFATIKYDTGPAMISRDDTKRRVVIGINVRNRDLQSVVTEVQQTISKKIKVPSGYQVTYGGQYENLQKATQRLLVLVPISLLLIFVMLYFAFHSFKEAILIFTAIPLATIGGVLALYFRDMPFSISAGIGFIALFGIAVLNGIVMIEHFKELRSSEDNDGSNDYIIKGAIDRIRPVILTAVAAALGFLPMAISSSAGAEVQRPLATVVIGGLISATLLTLFILPILYSLFMKKSKNMNPTKLMLFGIILLLPQLAKSQNVISLDDALQSAKANNYELQSSRLKVEKELAMIEGVNEINKTDFFYEYDHNNKAENNKALHVIGLSHTFKARGVNKAKEELQQAYANVELQQVLMKEYEIEASIKKAYDNCQYQNALINTYLEIVDIYKEYQVATDKKYNLGAITIIDKLDSDQKMLSAQFNLKAHENKLQVYLNTLKAIMNTEEEIKTQDREYAKVTMETMDLKTHPSVYANLSLIELASKQADAKTQASKPDWNVGLFNGLNNFSDNLFYPGVQAGVSLPLSKKSTNAIAKASQIDTEIATLRSTNTQSVLQKKQNQLLAKLSTINESITLYQNALEPTTQELLDVSKRAFDKGEIDQFQYYYYLENLKQTKLTALEMIHEYNQTAFDLQYLIN